MNLFFSIITPTLQRESLVACCDSIDAQTLPSWQHIVMVDAPSKDRDLCIEIKRNDDLGRRWVHCCGVAHKDGGNTCRRTALFGAMGQYIYFCDDDNYLADDRVLEDMATALEGAGMPPWGLFPITRLGGRFFTDPPRSCHVDTMNFVLRSDIAYWPDTDAYGTDGILVDDLMARGVPYVAFPNFRPIGVIPKISFCK
jgi:glycosyltransferase involved in cell wall biosynthesis